MAVLLSALKRLTAWLSFQRAVERIPPRELLGFAQRESARRVAEYTNGLREGKLTVGQWRWRMQREIKDFHITATLLGKREVQPAARKLTPGEIKIVSREVARQFKYLRAFRKDVDKLIAVKGLDKLPRTVERRGQLYIEGGENSYWRERNSALPITTQVFWRLSPAEHCTTCVERAGRHGGEGGYDSPWTPDKIPWRPQDGTSICKTNCKCWLEYRETVGEVA